MNKKTLIENLMFILLIGIMIAGLAYIFQYSDYQKKRAELQIEQANYQNYLKDHYESVLASHTQRILI